MSWFRRTRPAPPPPPRLAVMDELTAAAHGHTPASWAALTDQQRAKARDTYTKAPRYAA